VLFKILNKNNLRGPLIRFLKKYMYVFCLLIASWSWSTSCVGHLSFMVSMVVEVWFFLAVVAEK
jgi:hypothetical protein